MADHRFDDITRAFATRRTRRSVLGALGGAIAALGLGSASAQSNGNGNGNGNGNVGSSNGNGNGNGNANTGSFNGNRNGNHNSGWRNGNGNGNGNRGWRNGNGNGNGNRGWGNGNGNGNGNGWPQLEPTDCTEGAMKCEGTGYLACADGSWVYRDCVPGTACREDATAGIVCDWPTDP